MALTLCTLGCHTTALDAIVRDWEAGGAAAGEPRGPAGSFSAPRPSEEGEGGEDDDDDDPSLANTSGAPAVLRPPDAGEMLENAADEADEADEAATTDVGDSDAHVGDADVSEACGPAEALGDFGTFRLMSVTAPEQCLVSEDIDASVNPLPYVISTRISRDCSGYRTRLWELYRYLGEPPAPWPEPPDNDPPDDNNSAPDAPAGEGGQSGVDVDVDGVTAGGAGAVPEAEAPGGGVYIVYNSAFDYTLGVEGPLPEAGADLVLYPTRGRFPEPLRFESIGNGEFQISLARDRSLCMTESAGDAELWPCADATDGQRWALVPYWCP